MESWSVDGWRARSIVELTSTQLDCHYTAHAFVVSSPSGARILFLPVAFLASALSDPLEE